MPSHIGPHLMWQPGLSWHMVQMGPVNPSCLQAPRQKIPVGHVTFLLPVSSFLRFISPVMADVDSFGGKWLHPLAARHHVSIMGWTNSPHCWEHIVLGGISWDILNCHSWSEMHAGGLGEGVSDLKPAGCYAGRHAYRI